jgi:hypothetical protein
MIQAKIHSLAILKKQRQVLKNVRNSVKMVLISRHLNKTSKTSVTAVLSVVLIAIAVAGCAGSPRSGGTPEWLSSYPADPAYYVGIGGSSTGNLAEDREKAAAAARNDLAAQISAQVSSELDISTRASSDGDFEETVERTVNESVAQNLKAVEIVDSWFSPEQGAWVYVRLSKAVWAAIINQEIADLTLRTNTMVEPVVAGRLPEAENLAALGRARKALLESPWGLRVKDASFGTGGFLFDAIDAQISKRVGTLKVQATSSVPRVKFGKEIKISGRLSSPSGAMGVLPILVTGPKSADYRYATEADGTFSFTLAPQALSTGTMRFDVLPDLAAWEIPPGAFSTARTSVEFFVEAILLGFSVDSSAAADLTALDGVVADWVSSLPLPVETVPRGRGDVDLEFAWTVFDLPRLASQPNAPYISQVGAVMTVSRNGNKLYVKEFEPYKDGGLDWKQAHARAARGLLKEMAEYKDLPGILTGAFGM